MALTDEQTIELAQIVRDLADRVSELERVSYRQVLVNYDMLLAFHEVVGIALILRAPSLGDFSEEMAELRAKLAELAPRLKSAQIGGGDGEQ